MSDHKPAFLITIDTEGDNLWACPDTVTTKNVCFLPRFQELCENYGFKPTWLTNYEIAECPVFCKFGRDVLNRNVGEIGMHLHAWNSPPFVKGGPKGQSYLIEFSEKVMREKITFMTDLLEERFQRKMLSHRARRWALDSRYACLLVEHGYLVDCSVTPYVSWVGILGDPDGLGGSDYTYFPNRPYFMNLQQIDRERNSPLLEVPVTIVKKNDDLGRVSWLRPDGQNLQDMLAILEQAHQEQWLCVEFMLHSSEFMPGASLTFISEASIEALYTDLEVLFDNAADRFQAATLSEFYVIINSRVLQ